MTARRPTIGAKSAGGYESGSAGFDGGETSGYDGDRIAIHGRIPGVNGSVHASFPIPEYAQRGLF